MTFTTYSAKRTTTSQLSQSIRWSVLRRIGNSPFIRATIAAPFLGYAILFNEFVVHVFNSLAIQLGKTSIVNGIDSGLYYLYFGLICLGIASIIYALLCPRSVAQFPDQLAFSKQLHELGARTVSLAQFDDILLRYNKNSQLENEAELADFPEATRVRISELVVDIFKSYEQEDAESHRNLQQEVESEEKHGDQNLADEQELEFWKEFYTGSGYYNAEEIARRAYQAPKVIWAFSEPYRSVASKLYAVDIAFLKYEIDDYSNFLARLLSSALFAAGFILISIPSIRLFLSISGHLIGLS